MRRQLVTLWIRATSSGQAPAEVWELELTDQVVAAQWDTDEHGHRGWHVLLLAEDLDNAEEVAE